MPFGAESNPRYKVREIDFEGTIHTVGELTPYGGGQGMFRNIVICVPGMFNTLAYVPMTVFNENATALESERDKGRGISCTTRLQTSQYHDRNGILRWSVSFSVYRMKLEPIEVKTVSEEPENPQVTYGDPGTEEELPF